MRSETETKRHLPTEAFTRDGHPYAPRQETWAILHALGQSIFRFEDLNGLSLDLVESTKLFIMSRLRTHSVLEAHSGLRSLRMLLLQVAAARPGATSVMPADLMNLQASLPRKQLPVSTDVHRSIRQWVRLGLPGVEPDTFAFASEAESHRYEKGRAVRTRDPLNGPYTDLEYDGLQRALHAAFAAGKVARDNYCICLLSLGVAPRPSQIALLKVRDLTVAQRTGGPKTYLLAVPRVKQRGRPARYAFTERSLIEEVGSLLESQAEIVLAAAVAAGASDPNDAPMFPVHRSDGVFVRAGAVGPAHNTHGQIGSRVAKTLESLKVRSERTGDVINAHATRSRRTIASRAAADGRDLLEIAELLDHSDTQNVLVYAEGGPGILKRIDKSLANHLAPLAQRFAGIIASQDQGPEHGVLRHVLGVSLEGGTPTNIGGCGRDAFCGLAKPLACYTCILFRPWLDGPHDQFLDALLAKRERVAEVASLRVAAVNDETILAVAQVAQRCRAMLLVGPGDEADA